MKAFKLVIIVLALAVGLTSFNADAKKRKTTRRVAKKAKIVEPAPSGYDYVKGTNDNDEVLEVVEYMPEYPGGNEGLMKFLAQNIQYPRFVPGYNKSHAPVRVLFTLPVNFKL